MGSHNPGKVEEKLATRSVQKQEGKPDRHIYAITRKGRDELRQWLLDRFYEKDAVLEEYYRTGDFSGEPPSFANLPWWWLLMMPTLAARCPSPLSYGSGS